MRARLHVLRASWTLIDQGLVSLGTFLVNVQLARQLPQEEFGTFALLYGGFLALQLFNSSLLLYPMSIRLTVLEGEAQRRLQATTALLVLGFCLPLMAVLGSALSILGRSDLVLAALTAFLCWQMQETLRRTLQAKFRYSAVVIGDAVAYLGQVAAVAALGFTGQLTLTHTLEAMAGCYAIAALIQMVQTRLSFRLAGDLRNTALDYWSVGSWSLLNNLVSMLRVQILPWTLATAGGPAAAASFQAALNVVNLTNPITLGLCNIIPQTAAKAQHSGGNAEAWRASRIYLLIGIPPILGYYALVLLAPGLFLGIFYGSGSPYLALTPELQILAAAWTMGYVTDMICSYLHGVNNARFALVVNMLGAITAAVLALPLIKAFGLTAGCAALLIANFVRLAVSYYIQRRITAHEYITA